MGWKDAVETYKLYVNNCAKRLENPQSKVECMTIKDSSHIDHTDSVLCQQFEYFCVNKFLKFAEHGEKPQGNNREFHEFLGML